MQLKFLGPLYERPGPWASVYLDATRNTSGSRSENHLRWGAAAESLRDEGCDAATIESLARAVEGQHPLPGRHSLALFAARGEVGLVAPMPGQLPAPMATVGSLPHVMPLVAQHGEHVPWLRVVVDHAGADLMGATASGVVRTGRYAGAETPLHKNRRADSADEYSEHRYQRYAELSWQRHATDAAAEVAKLADETDAEVIVIVGDPHSRPQLLEHLPPRWQRRSLPLDLGSRGQGADPQRLDEATDELVTEAAEAAASDVIDRFRRQGDRHLGVANAVEALQRAQVDTMLFVEDPTSTLSLWVGPEPTQIAEHPGDLRAMGVDQPLHARADDALVRAIVGTGADLIVVDPREEGLDDTGFGVLLRGFPEEHGDHGPRGPKPRA
jgi:hypothetical protein